MRTRVIAQPANLPHWPLHLVEQRLSARHNADFTRWQRAVDGLPAMQVDEIRFGPTVTIGGHVDENALAARLLALHPWRKGPFRIGGVCIDTEWRSDWKWQRLAADVAPRLDGSRILDIGCGNGYFGWRMLEAGAREVIGIDPAVLFCMQHRAIQQYANDPRNHVLPLAVEELPAATTFDAVFSMGVIYHRRDPRAHVGQIFALTAPGGTAVLESLVCDADDDLVPPKRYARMRNVWCIPTLAHLRGWMAAAGFVDVHVVDVCATTTDEQRTTPWMHFESLREALDNGDPSRTVEGHPAPVRAILMATKPSPDR